MEKLAIIKERFGEFIIPYIKEPETQEIIKIFNKLVYNQLIKDLGLFEVFVFIYFYNDGPINDMHNLAMKSFFKILSSQDIRLVIKSILDGIKQDALHYSNIGHIENSIRRALNNIDHHQYKLQGKFKMYDPVDTSKRGSISHIIGVDDQNLYKYYKGIDIYFHAWKSYIENTFDTCIAQEFTGILFIKEYPSNLDENLQSMKEFEIELKEENDVSSNFILLPNILDLLKNCRERYLLVPFVIMDRTDGGMSHANAIIFDIPNRRIYHFEPYGRGENDSEFEYGFKQYPETRDYTYISTSIMCPYIKEGPQFIEEIMNIRDKSSEEKSGGYCWAWSMMFIHFCLLNPDMTPIDVYNYIMQRGNFRENITKYASWLQSLVEQTGQDVDKPIEFVEESARQGSFYIDQDKEYLLDSIKLGMRFDKFIKLFFNPVYLQEEYIDSAGELLDYIQKEKLDDVSEMEGDLNKMGIRGQPWVPLPIKHYAQMVKNTLKRYVEKFSEYRKGVEEFFLYYFHERFSAN